MGDTTPPDPSDEFNSGELPLSAIPLHSTNLLTLLDEDGTIRFESPAIERIFGFDQEALVGEHVADYFHPADREPVVERFRSVVASEDYTTESVEYRHERADGTYLWVESATSSNPTPDGYYVVNTRDISDRRAREEDLERTNERLEEFAGVVSHDLRNPLNVATGQLELARVECENEHLEHVARAHDRMKMLIDDLLTLARARDGVDELEPVDLATLAETCWRTVATKEATLVTEIDRVLLADRSRLQQLLENLIRNAVEHGGDTVHITVGETADSSGFYVADDGRGIDEEVREWVFESGYSTGGDGGGLGLAIVQEIVDAHEWTIALTESSDGGARFEITDVEFR